MRVTTKTTIELDGTRITVGNLRELLEGHDARKVVWVRFSPGDPRDPREHDTVRLEISDG